MYSQKNSKHTSRSMKYRLFGWASVIVAFVLGYLFWIVSRHWWTPSLVIFGILFVAICIGNCYAAAKFKVYDLYFAAILSLAAPAIVIFVAFGFAFSGPPA